MELGAIPVIPEKTSCSGDACRDVVCCVDTGAGKIKVRLGLLLLKAVVTDDDRCAATNGSIVGKPLIALIVAGDFCRFWILFNVKKAPRQSRERQRSKPETPES
jgi:hypothetical protein